MKKNTRTITSILLGFTTVSSIALALHFNSLNEDLVQSHNKLNAKYTDVLVENEELLNTNQKVSGLLEQSQMEIEKLNEETDNLQKQVAAYKKKVAELEKKLNSTP